MNNTDGKFLVQLVDSLSQKHLFFGIWGLIVFGFAFMMYNYMKKGEQRNFREDGRQIKKPNVVSLPGSPKNSVAPKKPNTPRRS